MVKVKPTEPISLEEIKTRVRALQELVSSLKAHDLMRAKKLELIRQEKLFLEQALSELKIELEQHKDRVVGFKPSSRVLN